MQTFCVPILCPSPVTIAGSDIYIFSTVCAPRTPTLRGTPHLSDDDVGKPGVPEVQEERVGQADNGDAAAGTADTTSPFQLVYKGCEEVTTETQPPQIGTAPPQPVPAQTVAHTHQCVHKPS